MLMNNKSNDNMHILKQKKRLLKHDNIPNVNVFLSQHVFFIFIILAQCSCAMQFQHNLIIVQKNLYKAIGSKNDRQIFSYDKSM